MKESAKAVRVNIDQVLKQNNAAYVLITCKDPTGDGKMQVELTYDGDPHLASYLLESAQGFIQYDE